LDMNGADYVDRQYEAACITEPKNFENFDISRVHFDASTSRAINVSNGVVEIVIPGVNDVIGDIGRLSWFWTFNSPDGKIIQRDFENATDSLAYDFNATFPIAGDNSATLKLDLY